jgi:hypothetical protein|eukprot:COSAG05_NODE_4663_length_1419_cov_17.539394_1_plen_88_part_00
MAVQEVVGRRVDCTGRQHARSDQGCVGRRISCTQAIEFVCDCGVQHRWEVDASVASVMVPERCPKDGVMCRCAGVSLAGLKLKTGSS